MTLPYHKVHVDNFAAVRQQVSAIPLGIQHSHTAVALHSSVQQDVMCAQLWRYSCGMYSVQRQPCMAVAAPERCGVVCFAFPLKSFYSVDFKLVLILMLMLPCLCPMWHGMAWQHAGGDEQDERRKRHPERGEENVRRQITAAATATARRSDGGASKTESYKVRMLCCAV